MRFTAGQNTRLTNTKSTTQPIKEIQNRYKDTKCCGERNKSTMQTLRKETAVVQLCNITKLNF